MAIYMGHTCACTLSFFLIRYLIRPAGSDRRGLSANVCAARAPTFQFWSLDSPFPEGRRPVRTCHARDARVSRRAERSEHARARLLSSTVHVRASRDRAPLISDTFLIYWNVATTN